MAQRIDPDRVAASEDPIALLAGQLIDVIMDNDDYLGACNRLVFRQMGLHPKTQVGGDSADRVDFYRKCMEDLDLTIFDLVEMDEKGRKELLPDYIVEDDPRFQLYYELLSAVTTTVLGQMIASTSFRWKAAFADKQKLAAQNLNTVSMGETNG